MKKLLICMMLGSSLMAACDGADNANRLEEETVATEDTVGAGSQAAAVDTILQKVNTVTLRAVGNSIQEVAFEPDTIEVAAGALVKLTLVNEGSEQPMVHNVIFTYRDKYRLVATEGARIGSSGNYTPQDTSLVIAASPMAKPGQTVEMDFEAPLKPGEYDFVCSYPGHYERMHGTLIVK
ncbi:cupredoxin domain-containing protein [Pontibacter ruber]|uniref:Cupredoxin domain-containing protein n=1 Tax=Pontibacter ruber TaxID=1343895 RepID=A0ABW5CSG1_9BACT|nr:plastocyanin/azurin family copper-binding protein [Pontibacter ruber]